MNSSVFLRADFINALPYVRDRDRRGCELPSSAPTPVRRKALALRAPCVHCGRIVRPFRLRSAYAARPDLPSTQAYVSLTCRTTFNSGCNRTKDARDAMARLRGLL